jgi:hypothetical protein
MYFPYGIWRDAERDSKKLPPSDNNGCGVILTIFIGGILAFSCFSAGGLGVLFGLAIIVGILQGMNNK